MGPGDESHFATQAELAGQLRHAFIAGELTAYYQPQYDLSSGRVVALEALCRWRHPRYGLLLPRRFIDVAEQYGLIAAVGHFMLEESGRLAADWHRRGIPLGMAINASPSELGPGFAETLLRRLTELELPHRALTVEVTESPAISNSRAVITTLTTLIDGGVGVAIDDFGAGHTSLDLVRRLPLTEVKIDKSLVQDPARSTDDLVRRCIGIARERDAVIVAEGVETQEHFDRVMHWGCDRAQGFYFAPPVPGDDLDPFLLGVASL
ncbi:EAL domain-containing protein [Pseudolysinimonas sp.]|uniref:EAL domain-containing protein n=1 Tax=Pseudolysinimonas sp. TaxID=2680009 RepID=UPI00286A4675|nr:EAL domain-containing protein [Pseudolysinimonas sp.]